MEDTNREVLAMLDSQLQFRCDYGHDGSTNPPCQYAADWSATVHECVLIAPCGCPKMFCDWHYLDLTEWLKALLEMEGGMITLPCGFPVARPEDFIWGARRLHEQ